MFRGNDLIDKADAECLVGVDGCAGEHELERDAAAYETRQPLRSAISGENAESYLWLAEARRIGSDAYCAGHGKLAAAAEGVAVEHRDDGLGELLDASEGGLAACSEGRGISRIDCGDLVDIRAGGEGFVTCTAKQDNVNDRIRTEGGEGFVQFAQHRGIERVVNFLSIERDGGDVFSGFDDQGLKLHGQLRLLRARESICAFC